jgi:hypothetical protein
MSFPCQCPPIVKQPNNYKAYTCSPETLYINYYISQLLLRAPYYNYIQTGVNQAPYLKNKYSYKVPIYLFKYYSITNPNVVLKTYDYQQVFNIYLIAQQYKTLELVPFEVKDNWDAVDKEFYEAIVALPIIEPLYQAVALASAQRAAGRYYTFTFTIPWYLRKPDIPQDQVISKCYTGDELITISRNAQLFVNAYIFDGRFPDFTPNYPI